MAAIKKRIADAKIPIPTIIIFTGHGYHFWWNLASPISPDEWLELEQRLCKTIGSDDVGTKISSGVLRIPDLKNTKRKNGEPDLDIKIVEINGVAYKLNEISDHLPKDTAEHTEAKKKDNSWCRFNLNWDKIDFLAEADERCIPYNTKDATKNHVLFSCMYTDGHTNNKDVHPSFLMALKSGTSSGKTSYRESRIK